MRVLLAASSLHLSNGGPSENVPLLADSLIRQGVQVGVISPDVEMCHRVLSSGSVNVFAPLQSKAGPFAYWRFARNVIGEFKADIVHDNGIWLPSNHSICRVTANFGKKLVISPRGMLEPWSLRYKSRKKTMAWYLYQKQDLMLATKLVATGEGEKRNIQALLPRSNVAVVPNGWQDAVRGQVIPKVERSVEVHRKALFFSRVHPKKGLDILIPAWGKLRPDGWRLDIVGPGEESYINSLKRMVRDAGLGETVRFSQPVFGVDEKNGVIRSADVVILPTYSENFGSIVVEAMGLGVPVITTTGTPWSELAKEKAGWWVEPSVDGVLHALAEAVSLTDDDRRAMGARARNIVLAKYSWESVAKRMVQVYKDALSGAVSED